MLSRFAHSSKISLRTKRFMSSSTGSQWGDWPATRVRETYLDYFKQHGHDFVKSSSTIPYEDPTLLFANAGYVAPFPPVSPSQTLSPRNAADLSTAE